MNKFIALVLALFLAFSLTVNVAEAANPWTGRWTRDGAVLTRDVIFWQDGNKVVGAHLGSNTYTYDGTLKGSVLKGTCTMYTGADDKRYTKDYPMELTLSDDESTINGDMGLAVINVKKIADYNDITPNYGFGDKYSYTGLWVIDSNWWGGILISQDGNNVTGISDFGNFEGTVSGNVLAATVKDSEYAGSTIRMTMSRDGMRFKIEAFFADGNPLEGSDDGFRLSRITYTSKP